MDAQQMLLAHFEKGILGAFGVWLLIVLSSFATKPEALQKNDELTARMKRIGKYMKKAKPDLAPMPDYAPRLRNNLSPGSGGASAFPDWVMHKRPQFLYGVEEIGPGHNPTHESPTDLALNTDTRGKIGLSWAPSVDNEYVIIANYEIERRVGDDGEWENIGSIDGVEESFEDANIKSRMKYYYRVVSIAEIDRDNPVVDAEGMQLPEAMERKVSREAGPVETARDVFIVPITVTQVTRDDEIAGKSPKDESAYLRVVKWDTEAEGPVAKAFTVRIDGEIGKVARKGRKKIDFGTGAVLLDVEVKQRKHKLGHMEPVQWIKVRYADGTEEEWTDKDELPEEFKSAR